MRSFAGTLEHKTVTSLVSDIGEFKRAVKIHKKYPKTQKEVKQ